MIWSYTCIIGLPESFIYDFYPKFIVVGWQLDISWWELNQGCVLKR